MAHERHFADVLGGVRSLPGRPVHPPEQTPVHVAIAACLGRHIDS